MDFCSFVGEMIEIGAQFFSKFLLLWMTVHHMPPNYLNFFCLETQVGKTFYEILVSVVVVVVWFIIFFITGFFVFHFWVFVDDFVVVVVESYLRRGV